MSATTAPEDSQGADLAAWLAVAAGTLGAFMAVLDISIVNSSLPTIQAEIGATPAEGTWIGTSYLVAEIVITPLTGWLQRMLGLRRLLLIAAGLFTAFSVLCGLATDLTTMILGRIGQGFTGGSLIPTAMTIVATRLPPRQQAAGIGLFGTTVIVAPVIGPVIGGWMTESYSWHYAFFINVPICMGLMALLLIGLPTARANWREFWNADWAGIAGMVVALGSLTVLLEEGHRELWFESAMIWRLAALTVVGAILIAWGQLRSERPVVRLSLFRQRIFASTMLMVLVVGTQLIGVGFVVPQFLAVVAGYNAFQAGQTALFTGASALVLSMLLPMVAHRIDLRAAVAGGLLTMSLSCWISSGQTSASSGNAFVLPLLLLGIGITMSMFFLNQSTINSAGPGNAGEAAGIFMAIRNLGGSIGLAMIATVQDWRLEFHHWQLNAAIGANDPAAQQRISDLMAQFGGGPEALTAAYRALDAQVISDAMVMSYNDVFLMLMFGSLFVAPFAFLLRPSSASTNVVMH